MKRDRDPTRIIRSWLEDGVTVVPDRVLDAVQEGLHVTPQRRAGWLSRLLPRFGRRPLSFGIAAAAVVVAAILGGVPLLPREVGDPGQPTPTSTSAGLTLASGTFTAQFGSVTIDATVRGTTRLGQGMAAPIVWGQMDVTSGGDRFLVDLRCARESRDGQLWIGGIITDSTHVDAPEGGRVAIVFERGNPVRSVLWFEAGERAPSCDAFVQGGPSVDEFLEPIQGQVELGLIPAPAATPTSQPTRGPIPEARALPRDGSELDPGWYELEGFPARIVFDVPVGYAGCTGSETEQGICAAVRAPALGFLLVENVVEQPCSEALRTPAPASLDELVTAISSLDGFEATQPVDVSIDGFTGKRFVVTAPSGAGCNLLTWATAERTNGVGRGEVNELTILEIDGAFVMFSIAYFPAEPAPDGLAVLRQVVDSIRIGR